MKTWCAVGVSLGMLACSGRHAATPDAGQAVLTPEEALAHAAPGSDVTVEGTVFTLTFDQDHVDGGSTVDEAINFVRHEDRWVLIRTVVPAGVTLDDLQLEAAEAAFALGIHLDPAMLAAHTVRLPQLGDVVRAHGTFSRQAWNGNTRPMLINVTRLDIISGEPPLLDVGAACARDMDCLEHLMCDRATQKCAPLPRAIEWDDPWHDINGACSDDTDCPLGQSCALDYAIVGTGMYGARYAAATDTGRHLCVPSAGMDMQALCPHPRTAADLVGGRFSTGKEVCIDGTVFLAVQAEDGDTHQQLKVPEPLPYPAPDAPYFGFGATTENGPPYKDPARPSGALLDGTPGQHIRVLGTYRYDDSHGWFEVHPLKAIWVIP